MAVHDIQLPDPYMTRTAYAKSRGISYAALQRAILEGRVTCVPGGLIDPEAADREWSENTGVSRGVRPPNAALDVPDGGGNGTSGRATLTELRAQHEQLKLELTQAELDERRGNQVPRDTVARTLEEEGRRLRDAVLQVPVQVAAALAACGDPQGCRLLVHEALREALQGCAEGADG